MYASENGHIEIVQLLLEQEGIDYNANNLFLNNLIFYNFIWDLFILLFSAILLAYSNGYIEIVKLLLEQEGIKLNFKDVHRNFSLYISIISYFKIIFGIYLNCIKQHLLLHLKMVILKLSN